MTLWTSAKVPERSSCETQDLSHAANGAVDEQAQAEKESWSSAIIGMVNSLRPSSTRSPTRRASFRHPTPPPPPPLPPSSSQQHQQAQQQSSSTPSPQQQHGNHTPTGTGAMGERAPKRIKLTLKGPRSPAVQTADIGNTNTSPPSSSKPPTKLAVAEPHGPLLQITNGVRRTLNVTEDALQSSVSPASTPDPSNLSRREPRKSQDRRSLRSQDEGSRLKSELAVYFPNYEDVIYDAYREPELLTTDTVIHISDEPYIPPQVPKPKNGVGAGPNSARNHHGTASSPIKLPLSPSEKRNKLNGAHPIDFSVVEKSVGHHPKDPLNDAFYFKSHRRAERKEKQLRNIEKERAMHEKAQLERLLEALQGHDWLRVMGINSVADSDAKKHEPKRNYFIDEVNALLMKFKTWKDEERRIRQEKEAAALAEEEGDEDEDESDGEPCSSDLDASAARQLQIEASGGAKGGKGGKGEKSKGKQRAPAPAPAVTQAPPPPAPPPAVYRAPTPEGPFISFYSKPHMRAAALGKSRHGRHLTAFGQPIPEVEEQEFALPDDYITPEAIRDNARSRRRAKRESAVNAPSK